MKNNETTFTSKEIEIFEYLNVLRDSGITNMFGASPYIVNKFGIEKRLASKILVKWMSNFNSDGYDHLTIEN
jgi:hypothetical protein